MEEIKPQRLDIEEMLQDEGWDFYVRANRNDLAKRFYVHGAGWATLAPGEAEKVLAKVKPPYGFALAGVVPSIDVTSPESIAKEYGWGVLPPEGEELEGPELEFAEDPQGAYERYLDSALHELPAEVLGARNRAEAFPLNAVMEDGSTRALACCLFELAG